MAPPGENRTKLIEAMKALSLSNGYSATTVDNVCARAKVSKGSFYHYFATKEEIGSAALGSYFDELTDSLTNGTFEHHTDPVDRLLGFIEHTRNVISQPQMVNGCLIGSYSLDLADTFPAIQSQLTKRFGELEQFVGQLVDDASNASGIALPSHRLSYQFIVAVEGSIVLAKAHADKSLLSSGIELFGDHIKLLLQTDSSTNRN